MKTGDEVRVINYGHHIWEYNEDGKVKSIDLCPEIIGRKGVIQKIITTQGITQYSLVGIPEKTAWYHEDQLELIRR